MSSASIAELPRIARAENAFKEGIIYDKKNN